MASQNAASVNGTKHVDISALVIGAGFGGIRMLYELRKREIPALAVETGSGVGGTWYWNRYPGARTDSESWVYVLTFLENLGLNWTWKERFPTQPEVMEYLNRITDYLDLRKSIRFNTRVTAAHFDPSDSKWRVTTSNGDSYTCKYLVSATGVLSTPLKPTFPGLGDYKGDWYHTGLWPKTPVDFTGKRVAVIGTGATAVQIIPIVAHNAKSLTVFQRTPNYVIPSRNHPLTKDQAMELKRDYDTIYKRARTQSFGMDMVDATRKVTDLKDDAEHNRVLESGWESGGFRFIFETFADMLTDQGSNDTAAEFVRNKIRSIVKDPETAELLCPRHPILSKRPPLGHFYYESYNRPNVHLVDVNKTPIQEISPNGIKTTDKEIDVDIIIFAVGFDAITGTLEQMDIRGEGGQILGESLKKNMETGYGITVEGFPNLFLISGPQAPFANIPVIIDNTADWIGKTISYMEDHKYAKMNTTQKLAANWREQVNALFEGTVLPKGAKETRSWYMGANVEGKDTGVLFYFGGVAPYFAQCEKEIQDGYPGYTFSSVAVH